MSGTMLALAAVVVLLGILVYIVKKRRGHGKNVGD